MGKETDDLLHLASEVTTTSAGREMDMLITAGERKATALMCMALHEKGVAAESYTGSQAGFITDTTHTNAKILEVRPDRLRKALESDIVPVVGGAQGVSTDHDVTFLGRGGSDTTAVALAQALGADACELYTDVSGVFTADPRLVPTARRIDHITLRRDARDVRHRLSQAGHALGRVRPHPRRAPARPLRLHLGAGHLDHRGGPHGTGHRLRRRRRRQRGQGDRHRRPGPSRHRRPAVPHAGRRRHQRRHDRAERVGRGRDRHLLHAAPRGPGPGHGDHRRDRRRDRRRRRHHRRARSPGSAWWAPA